MSRSGILCVALLASRTTFAGPIVSVSDTEGSFFKHKYELTVTAGDEEVLGVIVVNAFTIFNVGPASPITPAADWGFIPPFGLDDDGLFFFANSAAANIKKNTAMGGFIFESEVEFKPFQVAFVTESGVTQVTATPEPATMLLVGMAMVAMASIRRRRVVLLAALALPMFGTTVTLSDKFPSYKATDAGRCTNAAGGKWPSCGATGYLDYSNTQTAAAFYTTPGDFHGAAGEENFLLSFKIWNATQGNAWTLNESAPLDDITYDITNFTTRATSGNAGVDIRVEVELGPKYKGPPLDQLVWVQALLLNYRFQDQAGVNVTPYTTLDTYALSKDSEDDPAFKVPCAALPVSPNNNTPSNIPATPDGKAYCDPVYLFQYAGKHLADSPTGFYSMDSFRAEAFLATINTRTKTINLYDGGVNYGFDVFVTPEPASGWLAGAGIAILLRRRRRPQ